MAFTLIICTHQRPKPLQLLLDSVLKQTLFPNEILIIDGSVSSETEVIFFKNEFKNLKYFRVEKLNRGLTKQRNYGVNLVSENSEIVCFLDDDTILEPNYFLNLIKTYNDFPDSIGVGGIARNENKWQINKNNLQTNSKVFVLDGYYVKESPRNYLRNIFGLNSNELSGIMPEFSHGRTFSYPINNKTYPVDLLIGMSMSFRKEVFSKIEFSEYFEGYGLYEDADFSIRASNYGQNYINTAAVLNHYHNTSGRPNQFQYGKMVVRNGYYVWRVKYPNPRFSAKFKWLKINLLLIFIRLTNVFTTQKKWEALTESIGRIVSLFGLIFNRPI
ncbi:MAG: glycosyltransferase family 2 protein [Flavobacterium sp.]|nr:glycosyltransferase family 2 protein [Flavobacterium sp.]